MSQLWKILSANRKHTSFNDVTEQKWTGPFYFIQGADCQLGFIQSYLDKNPVPDWEREIVLTQLAVDKINAMRPKPRFFIICGDLCHAFPTREPELRAKQEADLKKVLVKLDPEIPLVCVCGNHDVGDQPTEADITMYKSSFGEDYLSFWCGGVLCLVLNSQLWKDCSQVAEQAARQDAWLEQQLLDLTASSSETKPPRCLIFQHIPWFLSEPQEPTAYFNLPQDTRNAWLPKFKAAGVEAIFCGHYHRNAGGWFEGMEVVTTSAIGGQLGQDSSGMRVVRVLDSAIKHQYIPLEDFPTHVSLE